MILNFSYGRQGCVWQRKSERLQKRNASHLTVECLTSQGGVPSGSKMDRECFRGIVSLEWGL